MSPTSPPTTIAIDARLVGGSHTGDTTYWTGLLHGLAQVAPDLRFLLLSNAERPPEIPKVPHFEWVHVPSGSSRWWSMIRFPLKARRMGADVLHTQYNLSPLAGPKGITTVHDVSFLIGPEWFRPLDRVLLSRFVAPSARRAARVITVSETSKRDIVTHLGLPAEKVVATPLAAGLAVEPMDREAAAALVEAELGLARPFVLTVGTRWPRKNMELAVQAVEGLAAAHPHVLALTGKTGWDEGELGSRTRPVGYVTDRQLSALYSSAEAYLAPSRYEGFGLTLLEAFRCGCPVLASRGGAHPEVAGDAARLMDSWEPADWASALGELLGDSSNLASMRERGLARAESFSWEATARLTADVYREVAG